MNLYLTRKRLIIGGAVLAGVLLLAGGGLAWLLSEPSVPPEPPTDDPKQLVEIMASKQFASLNDQQKQAYMQKLAGEGSPRQAFRAARELPDEQRQQFRENVGSMMRQQFEQRIDAYFALAPEQRDAYLDEQIDQMQAHRQQRQARRAEQTTSSGETGSDAQRRPRRDGPRRGFTPDRMKRRIEHSDPERRAKFMEYMKAMRERMEARGIEPPHHSRG